MDRAAATRLRWIGYAVVLVSVLLLWLPLIAGESIKYDDAIAGTLALGIGLLLLAEIGPWIKSLKAGGMEVEFVDRATDRFNELEGRIARLEIEAAGASPIGAPAIGYPPTPPPLPPNMPDPELAGGTTVRRPAAAAPPAPPSPQPERIVPQPAMPPSPRSSATESRAPALNEPITVRDDPHAGRFGGQAERGGYRLTAAFRGAGRDTVEIALRVEAIGTDSPDRAVASFHLHPTFDPDMVPVLFRDGAAELKLLAWGGFTVGVWIAAVGVELELNLAHVRGAPLIIKTR